MAALEVSTEGLRDADDVESSDSPATERRQLLQPSGNPQQMKSYSSEVGIASPVYIRYLTVAQSLLHLGTYTQQQPRSY